MASRHACFTTPVSTSGPATGWTSVDTVRIEGEVPGDARDGVIRGLVRPRGIRRPIAAYRDAVIAAVAFVGTIGPVSAALEQGHIDVLARYVLDGQIVCLAKRQGFAG